MNLQIIPNKPGDPDFHPFVQTESRPKSSLAIHPAPCLVPRRKKHFGPHRLLVPLRVNGSECFLDEHEGFSML
jgi:hypothetical protein